MISTRRRRQTHKRSREFYQETVWSTSYSGIGAGSVRLNSVVEKLRAMKLGKAAGLVEASAEETLIYCRFPRCSLARDKYE